MGAGRLAIFFGGVVLFSGAGRLRSADSLPELVKKYTAAKEKLLPIGAQRVPSPETFEELGAKLDTIVAGGSSFAVQFVVREMLGSERFQPRLAAVAARALLRSPGDAPFRLLVDGMTVRVPAVQAEILREFAVTKRSVAPFSAQLVESVARPLELEVKILLPAALGRVDSIAGAQAMLAHAAVPETMTEARSEDAYRKAVSTALRESSDATKRWLVVSGFERTPSDSASRTLLIELCGALSLVAAEPQLEAAVEKGAPEQAAAALASLRRLRVDAKRLATLVGRRKDGRDASLATAGRLRAAAEPRSASDMARLRDSLRSENPLYPLLAIRGLRRSKQDGGADLVGALDHADAGVREASWRAVVALRNRSMIGPLIERLESGREEDKTRALDLLRDLTGKDLGEDSDAWRRFWNASGGHFKIPPPGRVAATVVEHQGLRYFGIEVLEGRLLFLIDVSSSMKGEKIVALKRELSRLLRSLTSRSEINIVAFHQDVEAWKGSLTRVVGRARRDALEYIRTQDTRGGTNISDALEFALNHDRVDAIYLLSDGRPTAGTTKNTAGILRMVGRLNKRRGVRVHTISFARDSDLLKTLAAGHGGKYRLVTSFSEKDAAR